MRLRWHHAVLVLALVVTSRSAPPVHVAQPHAELRAPGHRSPVHASKRAAARTMDAGRHTGATSPAPRPSSFVLAEPPRTCVVSRPEPPATVADLALSPVHGARAPPQA